MLKPRTLKCLARILAGYGLLLLPAVIWPIYLDSAARVLLIAPWMSVSILHGAGVPGLLEHNGLCGWSGCAPTITGWLFGAALWAGIAWLVAWGIASLTAGMQRTKEALNKLVHCVVRQAHHERNQAVAVRPELVEGFVQRFIQGGS